MVNSVTFRIVPQGVFKWSPFEDHCIYLHFLPPQSVSGSTNRQWSILHGKLTSRHWLNVPEFRDVPMGIHTVEISVWAPHGQKILGDITIMCVNLPGIVNMMTYLSSSAKRDLDERLASALRFIISQCTLNSARMNSRRYLKNLTSG